MLSRWYGLCRFNELCRRTASEKVLCDKAFNIAKNLKYDRYIWSRANTFGDTFKSETMPNQQLPQEWHGPIIRKF